MAKSKLIGSFTINQALLLRKLFELNAKFPNKFFKPKELGAFKGNSILVTLQRFLSKNLVEFSAEERAYRISQIGISEYVFVRELAASVEAHEVFGADSAYSLAKAKKIFLKAS